jgi:hypothetical protein
MRADSAGYIVSRLLRGSSEVVPEIPDKLENLQPLEISLPTTDNVTGGSLSSLGVPVLCKFFIDSIFEWTKKDPVLLCTLERSDEAQLEREIRRSDQSGRRGEAGSTGGDTTEPIEGEYGWNAIVGIRLWSSCFEE